MSSVAPNFARIEVAPAYQKVADAIEREIVNGRIKPDDPIGTESELVQQFGVNRSTVREGIRVLEESGLIRRDSSRTPICVPAALQQACKPVEPGACAARSDVPRIV
jgi:GntR family transcriptional regulator, transcriptional repressor for pyruvate dehydrogenase complex